MLGNWFRQIQLGQDIEKFLKKNPRAVDQKKTECVQCGFCCHARPPSLGRKDLKDLAWHFNLTTPEFFQKYCVADYLPGEPRAIYLRRENQSAWAGSELSSSQTFEFKSPCVFRQKGGCILHGTKAKPSMCGGFQCWVEGNKDLQINEFSEREIETLAGRKIFYHEDN